MIGDILVAAAHEAAEILELGEAEFGQVPPAMDRWIAGDPRLGAGFGRGHAHKSHRVGGRNKALLSSQA